MLKYLGWDEAAQMFETAQWFETARKIETNTNLLALENSALIFDRIFISQKNLVLLDFDFF